MNNEVDQKHLLIEDTERGIWRFQQGALRALKKGGYTRNKACRCGSGIKFKHCCLPSLTTNTIKPKELAALLQKLKIVAPKGAN